MCRAAGFEEGDVEGVGSMESGRCRYSQNYGGPKKMTDLNRIFAKTKGSRVVRASRLLGL